MTVTPSSLDLSRLEKVRNSGGKITARCPACAENESDRKGNHLSIFPTGKFACAAIPGDPEHRRRIFALVGIVGDRVCDPERERHWRERRATERREALERQRLFAIIQEKRAKIIARHPWASEDVWEDSPQRIDCDLVEFDPKHFLSSLFAPDYLIWTGEVTDSGTRHADHWRSVSAWQNTPFTEIGPMTTPTVWRPDTVNRIAANVLTSPFTVHRSRLRRL